MSCIYSIMFTCLIEYYNNSITTIPITIDLYSDNIVKRSIGIITITITTDNYHNRKAQ